MFRIVIESEGFIRYIAKACDINRELCKKVSEKSFARIIVTYILSQWTLKAWQFLPFLYCTIVDSRVDSQLARVPSSYEKSLIQLNVSRRWVCVAYVFVYFIHSLFIRHLKMCYITNNVRMCSCIWKIRTSSTIEENHDSWSLLEKLCRLDLLQSTVICVVCLTHCVKCDHQWSTAIVILIK